VDEPDRSRGHRSRNLAIGLLLGALLIGGTRTLLFRGNEAAALAAPPIPAVPAGAEEHLAAALRFATVSDASAKGSPEALGALVDHLERTFPRVFAGLAPRRVGASLRCTWTGTDSSLPPALLMGHLDVVPVEPGTEGAWEHPPFAGLVTDGFVHGRGALDDKGSVIAILEAVELLLAEGFVPRRTLHLAFGHDEEIGGNDGAKAVSQHEKRRDPRAAAFLLIEEARPGVAQRTAERRRILGPPGESRDADSAMASEAMPSRLKSARPT